MSESIFIRVKRLVSGSVEDAVDAMERAGGTSVMREAIREVDRVVDEAKSERDAVTAKRLQAVRQQRMYSERLEEIQSKAQFAMDQGREDLAEAALHRQIDFEAQIEKLKQIEVEASEQERELEESLASLEMRKEYLAEELKHFEAAQMEANVDASDPTSSVSNDKRRVERAEAAFERAMNGAGGTTNIADVENTKNIAEIDLMRKKSEIESRMDALRTNKKKAS